MAHLHYIQSHYNPETIYILKTFFVTGSIKEYINKIANVSFDLGNCMNACSSKIVIDSHNPSENDFLELKKCFNYLSPTINKKKLLILLNPEKHEDKKNRNNNNEFKKDHYFIKKTIPFKRKSVSYQVSDLDKISQKICQDCNIKILYSNETNPLEMIAEVKSSKYLVVPYSNLVSQAFWLNPDSIFVELLPKDFNDAWTSEVTQIPSNIQHFRFYGNVSDSQFSLNPKIDFDLNDININNINLSSKYKDV